MPEEAPSGRGGVRGHRPSDRSVRPGLVAAPALLNALIHRSAWKENSPTLNFRFTAFSRKFVVSEKVLTPTPRLLPWLLGKGHNPEHRG
jgi:hypothetical protein